MRALVLREHGMGGLSLETGFPDPVPGTGDVVVRVRAASLNYHDVFTRRGMPGIKIPMPAIMGLDVAGSIVALGHRSSNRKPRDREQRSSRRDGAWRTGRILPPAGASAGRDPQWRRF